MFPVFPFLFHVHRRVGGKGQEWGTEASKWEFLWFFSKYSTFLIKVLVCGKIPFTRAGKVDVERKEDQNFKKITCHELNIKKSIVNYYEAFLLPSDFDDMILFLNFSSKN